MKNIQIGNKEIKKKNLSLFTDDMIIHVENAIESTWNSEVINIARSQNKGQCTKLNCFFICQQ